MMSRACLLLGNPIKNVRALAVRTTITTPASSASITEQTSRDCSTIQRPVRQEPGKVRLGFIPEEWFMFFYKKTGVTGPYTFGVALSTYLISKEFYVMEHEYYTGLSLLLLCVLGVKYMGPGIAKWVDKEVDEYEAGWNEGRKLEKEMLEQQIKDEKNLQWSAEGQNILLQAKRENVALQLEAAYRQRINIAYQEVKKRLDYQVELQNIEKRIAQKNLIDYVVNKVKSSITPDQEKQNIHKCISDLASLAKA